MADDITVEILKQIRDAIGTTNRRLESLEDKFTGLSEEVTGLRTDVQGLNVRMERVENGLNDLGQFMRQIALDQTKYEKFHGHHVDVLEKDVDDLRQRVRRLEDKSG
jgi:predicted  nucleic acid-binding Zn-ribbon protein